VDEPGAAVISASWAEEEKGDPEKKIHGIMMQGGMAGRPWREVKISDVRHGYVADGVGICSWNQSKDFVYLRIPNDKRKFQSVRCFFMHSWICLEGRLNNSSSKKNDGLAKSKTTAESPSVNKPSCSTSSNSHDHRFFRRENIFELVLSLPVASPFMTLDSRVQHDGNYFTLALKKPPPGVGGHDEETTEWWSQLFLPSKPLPRGTPSPKILHRRNTKTIEFLLGISITCILAKKYEEAGMHLASSSAVSETWFWAGGLAKINWCFAHKCLFAGLLMECGQFQLGELILSQVR